MSASYEPNPPSRKEEDFPKTTTIPEGWSHDALMETYNSTGAPTDNGSSNGKARSDEANTRPNPVVEDESLFQRRLDPFPKPNTIPTGWDLSAL
jgi:hypothetical protein